ncbi:hypothetical protein GF351_01935 [Candidatus Woesearchaeota archaeon]|nr:hypothetical protein [Candidatus Woesearchaeota archaeon]
MREDTLLRIALTISLVGIVCLYFVSGSIKVPRQAVKAIDSSDKGSITRIRGIVTSVYETDKVLILELYEQDPKRISAVVFKDGSNYIREGQEIEVAGEVREYKGEMELIADEIRQVS